MTGRLRRVGGAVAAGAALLACASPALGTCTPTGTTTVTVTCGPGLSQQVIVPDHAGNVVIYAAGGQGGLAALQHFSGSGGSAQGTLTQAGPFTLSLDVGAAGTDGTFGSAGAGGSPGGGDGAINTQGGTGGGGGGGGGYTQVTDLTNSTALMMVAGGGGAGGSNGPFGAGGDGGGGNSTFFPEGQPGGACLTPPQSSCPAAFVDGGGASTTLPGAGDSHPEVTGFVAGDSGLLINGGAAGAGTGGGGGGGGLLGGGGGGTDHNGLLDGGGGGGGGSTFIDSSLTNPTTPGTTGTDGVVTVTYTPKAAPAITSTGPANFTLGAHGTFTITSTGAPDATISLDAPGTLPAGLLFTAGAGGTGTISGTPTGAPSSVIVNVNADNGVGAPDDQPLTINVAGVAPAITSANQASFVAGANSSFGITSTGQPAATISLTGSLPGGLTFTPGAAGSGTGMISGTPTGAPGSAQVTVHAANGTNPDATQTVTVTVTAAPIAPSITSASPATFTIGTAGSYTISAAGSPTPPISLDDPADLPNGLSFSPGTGSAMISGTPTGPDGSFTVTVRAVGTSGPDATQKLVIEVAAPPGTHSSGGGFVNTGGSAGPPVTTTPGGTVGVSLGCAGASGTTCTGQVAVTVHERVLGSKVIAVTARTHKAKRKTVKVGVANYTIAAGTVKVVKVALNKRGRALLKRFHRMKVKVTVAVSTANGLSQAAVKTVTLKQPAKKKRRK